MASRPNLEQSSNQEQYLHAAILQNLTVLDKCPSHNKDIEMTQNHSQIQHIVIVGGGTAGWLAAATFAKIFAQSDVKVTVVESPEVGIIGVGEATLPHFLASIRHLGIDEVDFIRQTQSTFKWGIQFCDWGAIGEEYFHSFGRLGRPIDGHDFYQVWLKARAEGDTTPLSAYSPETLLAKQNRFYLPHKAAQTPLAAVGYALHLDAGLVGQYLSRFAQSLGVVRIEAHVEQVECNSQGDIARLHLRGAEPLTGDFFVDCTGFRGVLIDGALNVGYEDWSEFLPCNRAVTVASAKAAVTTPYTRVTAREAGWTWRIPLQHRSGNGYVYCSRYISDDEAAHTLLQALDTEPLAEPRTIPFVTGVRKKFWHRNCLSLGLAQGFLEPLESTAIHLVSRAVALFVHHFPGGDFCPELADEFNRRLYAEYEEIRDFLVMHYCTTRRSDTAFWRDCQSMRISESLSRKLEVFQKAGVVVPGVNVPFEPVSWQMVLTGMGVLPARYNPTIDVLDFKKLTLSMQSGRDAVAKAIAAQPSHDDFINQFCKAMDVEGK